ncbi:peroxidase [Massilia forsythiae]|uniref:Peroxidase n=1 Tax=Massilia forsythiae TaxID=2728020 RepID=A0A7Z2W0J5_9BURK|nr:Dyp-type peroxidase domain-containing protein [Massilia forsythiae]QJE02534.1 peroxidase [Massilia forsythiae]
MRLALFYQNAMFNIQSTIMLPRFFFDDAVSMFSRKTYLGQYLLANVFTTSILHKPSPALCHKGDAMPLEMNKPFSWKKALEGADDNALAGTAMLNDLQGNILKSHGRMHSVNMFLAFDPDRREQALTFIRQIGREVTSSMHQLITTDLFKAGQTNSGPYIGFFLTSKGYDVLRKEEAKPEDDAFRQGMDGRPLGDPNRERWDPTFTRNIHALLILAADNEERQKELHKIYQNRINDTDAAVEEIGWEIGSPQLNDDGNPLEHFGYVDGRSQPLALVEDIEREKNENGGIGKWDPSIPLNQLLVRCPGGQSDLSFGSYFVFRKLEQNVKGFKEAEKELGHTLGDIDERAGASVVGRFENGTPVAKFDDEQPVKVRGNAGVLNNFNYTGDEDGLKCPFAAHIRKTNPRSDEKNSKSMLMARRGVTYGNRTDGPNDDNMDTKPTTNVGLLFMAYQSSIENQFEATQTRANKPIFNEHHTGIDPVIGVAVIENAGLTKDDQNKQIYPKIWGKELSKPTEFFGFVKMKGGEYFFAPSISFLRSI